MTTIEKVVVVVALAATYFIARYEKTTKPTSYNDCILEHMPGTPSTGVADVRAACKALAPDPWAGFEAPPRPAD